MIKKYSLDKARVMEFYQAMSNVKTFLAKENLQTLQLEKVAKTFNEKFTAFDEALTPVRKSDLTQKIQELDTQRDNLLSGFSAHLKAFQHFSEPAGKEAAQRLLLSVEKFGKGIQEKPIQEETAIITNLLQDMAQASAQQDLKTIGAKPWTDALKNANTALEQHHNSRTEQQSTIEVGKTKTTRQEIAEAFRVLVQTINALALLNGKDAYTNLANAISQVVKNANQTSGKADKPTDPADATAESPEKKEETTDKPNETQSNP